MQREYALPITAITGPATDNEVGQVYITGGLGLAAHNARRDAAGLVATVRAAMADWAEKSESFIAAAAS
jgi:nicotinamide mononucleotide (NMN) deamidase PncC